MSEEESLSREDSLALGRQKTSSGSPSKIPAIAPRSASPGTEARSVRAKEENRSDRFTLRGSRASLVGRSQELAEIQEALAQSARDVESKRITVVGNQGTGKSRLIDEALRGLPNNTLAYRCDAVRNGGRYSTVAKLLRTRFMLSDSASSEESAAEFRREVEEVFGSERVLEVLHVLGRLLNMDFPGSTFLKVLGETPAQYDEVVKTVFRQFVAADSARGPIVLVIDDLQWADEASLVLLAEFCADLGDYPVALLVGARPELIVRTAWRTAGSGGHEAAGPQSAGQQSAGQQSAGQQSAGQQSAGPQSAGQQSAGPQSAGQHDVEHHCVERHHVELHNLSDQEAGAVFRTLLSRCADIPSEIVEDAVEMTGGNPYFLNQLVRLFLANGTVDASGSPWQLNAERAMETELSITVEEAIEGRIAALGSEERQVLEKGAAFGNVFWQGAVVSMVRIEVDQASGFEAAIARASAVSGPLEHDWSEQGDASRRVAASIASLVDRDYLLRMDRADSSVPGDVELVFKHNLEREFVAKGTEPSKLARYHRLAAEWIETRQSEHSEDRLEYLGQLYERGGDHRRAAHRYLSSGDCAKKRYANEQAAALYRKGLALLDEDDAVFLLDALHNLGAVLDLVGETAAAQEQFSRMLRNAWLFNQQGKGGAAHSRLGRIHRRLGEYDQALAHLRSAHERFVMAGDQRGIAGGLDDIGQVHWLRGDYAEARTFHEQALAIRKTLGDSRGVALCLANIGRVHLDTGAFMAASKQFYEALALRRQIGDTSGVIRSLCDLAGVHSASGTWCEALEMYEEARERAVAIGDKLAQADVLLGMGRCQASMGHFSAAIESLLEGESIAWSLGDLAGAAACHRHLADTYLMAGNGAQALDNAKRSLELARRIGSSSHLGAAHRVMGEALYKLGRTSADLKQAGDHFQKAVEILAGIHNEIELARTYRAYALQRERTGRVDEAAQLRSRAGEVFDRLKGAASVVLEGAH